MKKITSLLALFMVCLGMSLQAQVTDLSQLKENFAYAFSTPRSALYADGTVLKTATEVKVAVNPADPKQQFALKATEVEGEYYLYSIAESKYVNDDKSLTAEPGRPIQLLKWEDGSWKLQFDDTHIFNIGGDKQMLIDGWSSADDGNRFTIAEVGEIGAAEVQVTYTYVVDGQEVASETKTQLEGTAYNAGHFSYATIAYPDEEKVSATNNNIKVTVTEALPFEKGKYYNLRIHANGFYLSSYAANPDQNFIALDRTIPYVPGLVAENDLWKFEGNVVTGFEIVNKATGDEKVLSSIVNITNDGETFPVLVEKSTIDEAVANVKWMLDPSTNLQDKEGFYLSQKGYPSHKMNKRGNKLAYWVGGADAGSTFVVEEPRPETEVIAEYVEGMKPAAGCVNGFEMIDIAKMEDAQTYAELNGLLESLVRIPFDANKYYRVKNFKEREDMKQFLTVVDGGANHLEENMASVDQLWKFVEVEEGKYKLYNVNTGKYMDKAGVRPMVDEAAAAVYTVAPWGGDVSHFLFKDAEDKYLVIYGGGGVGAWTDPSVPDHQWLLFPAEYVEVPLVQEGNDYWATLHLPFAAQVDGAAVYTGKLDQANQAVVMKKVEGGVVPANNGVILKGAAEICTVYFAEAAEEVLEGNELQGVNAAAPMPANSLVLNAGTEGVGFFAPEAVENAQLKANSAYLVYEGEVPAEGFKLHEGEITGIGQVVAGEKQNGVYYDLSGRRVLNPVKGVYVKDGKKVLVK